MAEIEKLNIDSIIARLLEGKQSVMIEFHFVILNLNDY